MKKNVSAVIVTAILSILAGCASSSRQIPRYAAPQGAPSADLRSEIWGATDRNESIEVYVSEGRCGESNRKRLFYVRNSKSDPVGSVKVEANQPLRFEYVEAASGGRSCHIALEANLEAGKSYSLIGGFEYQSGAIPILTGTRMCRFAVQDDADKTLVSRKLACSK